MRLCPYESSPAFSLVQLPPYIDVCVSIRLWHLRVCHDVCNALLYAHLTLFVPYIPIFQYIDSYMTMYEYLYILVLCTVCVHSISMFHTIDFICFEHNLDRDVNACMYGQVYAICNLYEDSWQIHLYRISISKPRNSRAGARHCTADCPHEHSSRCSVPASACRPGPSHADSGKHPQIPT